MWFELWPALILLVKESNKQCSSLHSWTWNYHWGIHRTLFRGSRGVFSFRLNDLRLKWRMFQGFSDTVRTPLSSTVWYQSSLVQPTCKTVCFGYEWFTVQVDLSQYFSSILNPICLSNTNHIQSLFGLLTLYKSLKDISLWCLCLFSLFIVSLIHHTNPANRAHFWTVSLKAYPWWCCTHEVTEEGCLKNEKRIEN